MKLIDKAAIVAEINRRIKEIDEIGTYLSPKGTLTNLLCFLDTTDTKEVEEEPVSNDLEREIKHYVYDPYFDLNGVAVKGATDYLTVEDVADIARHFAQWQKERILNNATEREVKVDVCGYPYIDFTELYDYDKDVPLAKEGDKVKLVILGEDKL